MVHKQVQENDNVEKEKMRRRREAEERLEQYEPGCLHLRTDRAASQSNTIFS